MYKFIILLVASMIFISCSKPTTPTVSTNEDEQCQILYQMYQPTHCYCYCKKGQWYCDDCYYTGEEE